MNILVVEDKENVRNYIIDLLEQLGHSVDTAVNGLDGFEKAQQGHYHLYIIDHLMPLMNGVVLTKNLKKNIHCKNTPIIFMTTQNKKNLKTLNEFSLFDDVLSKPINIKDFALSVSQFTNNAIIKAS